MVLIGFYSLGGGGGGGMGVESTPQKLKCFFELLTFHMYVFRPIWCFQILIFWGGDPQNSP